VRGVVRLVDATQRATGVEAAFEIIVELSGSARPGLVAERDGPSSVGRVRPAVHA
jgi:hypothetical protein